MKDASAGALETLLPKWSGEHVVVRCDADTGAWIFIAVHSTRLGPATGGTRMCPYPSRTDALRDALRLAEGMTFKWAVVGMARGGGKAVIDVPEALPATARDGLLRRYGALVDALAGRFQTGPDMGTGPAEMDVISEQTTHVFGKSPERGGAGDPGPWTARGVFAGIVASCQHAFGSATLSGRRVLVQGVGHVGAPLIRLLVEAGAAVVASDIDSGRITALALPEVVAVDADAAVDAEVDVFAPCGAGGVLSSETIPRLRCRIVAGSANNQLARPEDADALRQRGILYAPDYVINAGGAIFLPLREGAGRGSEELVAQIDAIGDTLGSIYARADAEGISTEHAARQLAAARLC
jgi:leucine dehydrogenase